MLRQMLTLVAIADTHGFHRDLTIPEGDILIHAGDLTQQGTSRSRGLSRNSPR